MKKLLAEPLDFMVHYPLGYYIRTMFVPASHRVSCFSINPKATSLLIAPAIGGAGVFSDNIAGVEGAPNFELLDPAASDETGFSPSGAYLNNVVRKYKLNRGGTSVVILDHPRTYLNLHGMHDANVTVSQIYSELTKSPHNLLPGWQGGETYNWSALTDRIEVANDAAFASTLQVLFLAGLPASLVDFICQWSKVNSQTLGAIIPFPLAVAGWALEHYAKEEFFHLVVPGCSALSAFAFGGGKCTHYFAPKNDNFAAGEVAGAIEDVNASTIDESIDVPVFVWPTPGTDMEKTMHNLRHGGLRKASAITLLDENGLPLSPTADLCSWALRKCDSQFAGLVGALSAIDLPRRGSDES